MTPHIESKKEDIAKIVLMPGDPLRAKYIAENFLENYRLVNTIRNTLGYTGKYKGKEITVFASGMGMPSMGIYSYELFKFYDVEKIIRIGSCGAFLPNIEIFDTLLIDQAYTEGNFALSVNHSNCHTMKADLNLTNTIEETSKELNIKINRGSIFCNDFFDVYTENIEKLFERLPRNLNLLGAEMESFALFYIANYLGKSASCLLTVVDSKFKIREATPEERQTSLNDMILLALESAIK
ncbi:MAG: purine-nucleoside phosphorylase [Clostridia bacterium]|nr:purine-nucleoside phosphorylase [Clostridia bacterium]